VKLNHSVTTFDQVPVNRCCRARTAGPLEIAASMKFTNSCKESATEINKRGSEHEIQTYAGSGRLRSHEILLTRFWTRLKAIALITLLTQRSSVTLLHHLVSRLPTWHESAASRQCFASTVPNPVIGAAIHDYWVLRNVTVLPASTRCLTTATPYSRRLAQCGYLLEGTASRTIGLPVETTE